MTSYIVRPYKKGEKIKLLDEDIDLNYKPKKTNRWLGIFVWIFILIGSYSIHEDLPEIIGWFLMLFCAFYLAKRRFKAW